MPTEARDYNQVLVRLSLDQIMQKVDKGGVLRCHHTAKR